MLRDIDNYFLQLEEPYKSTMLFLRSYILSLSDKITEEWRYRMPVYYYKGKMFCYIRVHKKYKEPYIGVVEGGKIEHPNLLKEDRARMKIFLIDPSEDIPVDTIKEVLEIAMTFYK
ncbi:MAG: DUF1801 domain-containing protein [Chitinophagales bacterium]|nr:DUF1801 domain-containing protein [Chitinophagales bacterium]